MKIITITGGQGTGKSQLAKKIAKSYNCPVWTTYPDTMVENIKAGTEWTKKDMDLVIIENASKNVEFFIKKAHSVDDTGPFDILLIMQT